MQVILKYAAVFIFFCVSMSLLTCTVKNHYYERILFFRRHAMNFYVNNISFRTAYTHNTVRSAVRFYHAGRTTLQKEIP